MKFTAPLKRSYYEVYSIGTYGGEPISMIYDLEYLKVIHLSEETLTTNRLLSERAHRIELPKMEPQESPRSCLPTALRYVFQLRELRAKASNKKSQSSPFLAPSSAEFWDPFNYSSLNPFFGSLVGEAQYVLTKNLLDRASVEYRETTSLEEILSAASQGKVILFAGEVRAVSLSHLQDVGSGDLKEIRSFSVGLPEVGGGSGHAMVVAGYGRIKDSEVMLFVDPLSGELVPVSLTNFKSRKKIEEAIQFAFIFD